ncbi:haloacid dehalogenase type II [Streptomyces armeniacus]|uniref:Haloacid dehalogenase type II n=1 Tax=Streptomyces armeniacus TaxID=83291 RepID=A0A345XTZ9_9ACTN|nr:haloacid dehalogenase type II [Streptomyces armeniacus]AXK35115.1 haloacid dehalogenase type II [Streptomyces armeniacus]
MPPLHTADLDLDVDTIVFDILGTLVDHTAGLRAALAQLAPDPGQVDGLVALWGRRISAEHRRIVDGERAYAPGTVLDREAAREVAEAAGVSGPGAVDTLVRAARQRPAWPDSADALARLGAGHELIGLSNADTTDLLRMNASAGLRWHTALSTQAVGSYKPDPAVYRLAIDSADRPPGRMLMIAAHAWDLRGAQAAGLRTAYLERPGGDPPTAEDRFDLRLGALAELTGAPRP